MDDTSAAPPQARLPMVVTVGFSGHRTFEEGEAVAGHLRDVLQTVRRALAEIGESRPYEDQGRIADAYEGPARLRLLSGEAPGADRLIIQQWTELGLGEVHTVFPFRDPVTGQPLTDHPDKATAETRIAPPPEDAAFTGIDSIGLGLERDQAHAEVSHWITRHCELMIVVWNGEPTLKPGGSGDTLHKALERGVPAIWIEPGENLVRLIDPARLHGRADAAEFIGLLAAIGQPLELAALARVLAPVFAPPGGGPLGPKDPEVIARVDYAAVDPLGPRPWPFNIVEAVANRYAWTFYHGFELTAGGRAARPSPAPATPPVPPELARQPGFTVLTTALREAAARAGHLSAIHRSEQLLLIAIAIEAVLVGALPAVWRTEPWAHRAHLISAIVEFGLGGAAFLIARLARRAHRHRRWSDARRLAERLRAARATWPLGVDIGDAHVGRPHTWTEWRALAVLRAAGPLRGWLTQPLFDANAGWALAGLIDGQIAYHDRQHLLAKAIERWIKAVEGVSFGFLMGTLALFILSGLKWLGPIVLPEAAGGAVTVISAVSPAIGAGCLALEATNGYGELALRSERLAREFRELKQQLDDGQGASYDHIQDIARRSAQLLVEDADGWRDRLSRRRIVRGG